MELAGAIRLRKSIRGYKTDPVPKEVLRDIMDIAMRSPSGENVQPWEITIVTGALLDMIREANVDMFKSGAVPFAESAVEPYEGVFRQRKVDLATQILHVMGISREDKEKRSEWMQRGLRFFDAPAGIVISMDKSLERVFTLVDIGALLQTICLAALDYGLGTCINRQGIMFPDVLRRFTGISDSKLMVIAISVGYPDWDFPANNLEAEREPVERVVTWCGFD